MPKQFIPLSDTKLVDYFGWIYGIGKYCDKKVAYLQKSAIATASSYTSEYASSSNFGCFAKGTRVLTQEGMRPIQDIKVGDLVLSKPVLSKPEDGTGETSYKPVLKTFVHKDKEIWLVRAERCVVLDDKDGEPYDEDCYELQNKSSRFTEFLATPNHPVWVEGCVTDAEGFDIEFYPQGYWKRVDELQHGEVVINHEGVMYRIARAQPTYQFDAPKVQRKASHYWYQKNYHTSHADYLNNEDQRPDFDITEAEYTAEGYVHDAEHLYKNGTLGDYVKEDNGFRPDANMLTDANGNYIPFTDTVYNLEVADNHTYYIGITGLWVHDASNPAQLLLQTARDIAGGVSHSQADAHASHG